MRQYEKDREERAGYEQGYGDGQRQCYADPWHASPDFRQGYLAGHRNGRLDRRLGIKLQVNERLG